jgi:hypothetical protein
MDPLPATDLRHNLATWAVPAPRLPGVANQMLHALPTERFDASFAGQELATTYFDTAAFDLRKARLKGDRYCTVRIRCYRSEARPESYALSAKTDDRKVRIDLPADLAEALLAGDTLDIGRALPGDLQARLYDLVGDRPLVPVVTVGATRYAVEDDTDRLTLDVHVRTDTGKRFPINVLEFKSKDREARPPFAAGLRPIRVSKFLWATDYR